MQQEMRGIRGLELPRDSPYLWQGEGSAKWRNGNKTEMKFKVEGIQGFGIMD